MAQRQVGQQCHSEGSGGQRQTDDGEELHVPAIAVVEGVRIADEVIEGVGEGAQDARLSGVSS